MSGRKGMKSKSDRVSRRMFLEAAGVTSVASIVSAASQETSDRVADTNSGNRAGGRIVRVAAVQLADVAEGKTPEAIKAFHRRNIERTAREAARRGADIVSWHETAATYGVKAAADDRKVWEDAVEGSTTRWAADLAKELGVHLALPMSAYYKGALRNAVVFINRRGEVAGVYAKVHLTYGERQNGIVPGDSWPVVALDFGKVGAIVCHDMSFPESVRCLALGGAEIVLWPTHWSGWGDRLNYAVIQSRAIDNGLWLVQLGLAPPPGRAWRPGRNIARSGTIDPYGEYVASAGFREGMSIAEIDLDKRRIAHSFSTSGEHDFRAWMLADRRPDTYGAIVDLSLRPKPPIDQ